MLKITYVVPDDLKKYSDIESFEVHLKEHIHTADMAASLVKVLSLMGHNSKNAFEALEDALDEQDNF